MALNYTCGECNLRDSGTGGCQVFHEFVSMSEPACRKFTHNIMTCEVCGQRFLPMGANFINWGELWHVVCPGCGDLLGNCQTCKRGNTCEYKTNPDPMPKMIQKQVRRGNMVGVVQVKNPERECKFCGDKEKKVCECFKYDGQTQEVYCQKEVGYCEGWVSPWGEPTPADTSTTSSGEA